MPTRHQQVLEVQQRSDGAVIYNGRQYRTRTEQVGDVLTSVGRIDVGPGYGTGPTVLAVSTGFRPKVIFLASAMQFYPPSGGVSSASFSYGATIDDNGTLVRYMKSMTTVYANSYNVNDENMRIFSGSVSYRLYYLSSTSPLTLSPITGNILSVNDAGFTIEVDNTFQYTLMFLAIGGEVTVGHGRFTLSSNPVAQTFSFPFAPDSAFVFDLPFWNSEQIFRQQQAGNTRQYRYSHVHGHLVYGKYQGSRTLLFINQYSSTASSLTAGVPFIDSSQTTTRYLNTTATVSNTSLTLQPASGFSGRTLDFGYVVFQGLPVKIRQSSFTVPSGGAGWSNTQATLDFEPGSMMAYSLSTDELAFDIHERDPNWHVLWMNSGEINNAHLYLTSIARLTKRLAGNGNRFYGAIYKRQSTSSTTSGSIYFVQLASAPTVTVREMNLFVSSWYRTYLTLRRRWAKILSAINDSIVRLSYLSDRRTETELELVAQSDQESWLAQAWNKLLFARGFSLAEIFDTTWGRNLRKIRLLTPSDIDVCPGDNLVLRLKIRHGNHDRDMARMNDIVRMALLDYWTKMPVYWLGLGSGIQYDAEGQAVITIPWTVLDEVLGRDRICRYRVELWPDERLGVVGWIVHVGIIREAR